MRTMPGALRGLPFLLGALALGALTPPRAARAQSWGEVVGRVSGSDGEAVAGANVLVERTNYGTAADVDGRFALRLPTGRYRLRISAVGYRAVSDSVVVRRDRPALLNVRLAEDTRELTQVEVEVERSADAGVFAISPEDVQNLPGPFRSAFQAVRVLPGVAANNEISNQFSVRGGGLSENLIYLNGFEVYLPFRPKQGEQEGLGLLNPDLTDALTLYAGGFPARYGGKLASALDVRYHRAAPGEAWHGSASASLLDAGLATTGAVGKLGVTLGVRRAQAGRLFATQALQGRYDPAYTDGQAVLSYALAPGHEVEAVGVYAAHRFDLDPSSRTSYFGYISIDPDRPSNFQSVYTKFVGQERDGFRTGFAGLRLKNRLTDRFRAEHDVAYFDTDEYERYDITGDVQFSEVNPQSGASTLLGTGSQTDFADNRIRVRTVTGQGRYVAALGAHAAEVGWMARRLRFEDRIIERGEQTDGESGTRVVTKNVNDAAEVYGTQAAFYAQDAVDLVRREPGRFVATPGVRADLYGPTGEWTVSPRLLLRFRRSPVTTLTASAGVYYQPPTYQELRGTPPDTLTRGGLARSLNLDLKSQRAVQIVAGGEHFLTGKRLWLRAEAYYKALANLVSYDVENVRVDYSGQNDADGYVYGFDLQVRGEFVPGLESWANYGFLTAKEEFRAPYRTALNDGIRPRPTDQRHTFSLFVQDHVPGDRTWRLFMRGLYGSGYPYTALRQDTSEANVRYLTPGRRGAYRFSAYRRVDMGTTKELAFTRRGEERARLAVTAELLNVFDMDNEVAFNWVSAGTQWVRQLIRLTPRTVNLRARLTW